MSQQHYYEINTEWTGNTGTGTSGYKDYERSHLIQGNEKSAPIVGSSDPNFRGDKTRYNPEELLLAALSSCHMLWYLHFCAVNGVCVVAYSDTATGVMEAGKEHDGKFVEATLNPSVTISHESMREKALSLHKEANKWCFIANSCNFVVHHRASVKVQDAKP